MLFRSFREMLRIENLCRLVGFDERQTATLVKGKPLEYAGELYSEAVSYTHLDKVASTAGLLKYAITSDKKDFIVATESGILHEKMCIRDRSNGYNPYHWYPVSIYYYLSYSMHQIPPVCE